MWRKPLIAGIATASRGLRWAQRVLNEMPIVLQDAELERVSSERHYSAHGGYLQPERQQEGLYPFEERALHSFPPPPARLFVPGSGAGRELLALAACGYRVTGLEPNAVLAQAARKALTQRGFDVAVDPRTLLEWAARPEGRFDAVLTGWGLWVHVLRHSERVATLRAFRSVCDGPVLLSFWRTRKAYAVAEDPDPAAPLHPPAPTRFTRWTRATVRERWLRRPPVERGTLFTGFFAHAASEPELAEEARLAGYSVAWFESDVARYPNAVLVPAQT